LLDKPADVANRLAQPLFILHKCDTHKTFTVFVKGSTWSDCSLCVFYQVHRVINSAFALAVLLGHFCPNEHCGPRLLNFPADPYQTLTNNIPRGAASFVLSDYVLLTFSQGDDAGDLYSLKDTVIIIT
jgi:hypothetical protein